MLLNVTTTHKSDLYKTKGAGIFASFPEIQSMSVGLWLRLKYEVINVIDWRQ